MWNKNVHLFISKWSFRSSVAILFLLVSQHRAFAKNNHLLVTGYTEYLNNTWIPQGSIYSTLGINNWQSQSGIYNRFNFQYSLLNNLKVNVSMRNNFIFGPTIATYNKLFEQAGFNYNKMAMADNGYLDLTMRYSDNPSYLFYTNFDRANLKLSLNKLEITLGRQRINWSKNLVWNPNDIFNAYSYFEFNYVEKPGSDAALVQWYTGNFSSVQLAAKLGYTELPDSNGVLRREQKKTIAAMYHLTKWNYDFQAFGGVMEDDVTAGMGWAGSIAGAGFTGEVSWFRNQQQFADTCNVWIASVDMNYTFKNNLFVQLSGIYNSAGATGPAYAKLGNLSGSFSNLLLNNIDAKTLTRSRFDLFGELSYPVTPLIKVDLSSIFNPYDKSLYVGPTATFSLTENLSLAAVGQLFWGDSLTEFGDIGQMLFFDLKWSF